MKITMLSNSHGGVLSFTLNLARRLVLQGCAVHVFFLTPPQQAVHFVPSLEKLQIDYLTTSHFVPNLRALVYLFFLDSPDIVHINFAVFGPIAFLKKVTHKTPFVFTSHGPPQPWLELSLPDKIKYTVENLLLSFAASKASAIVAISNYVKGVLKSGWDIDSQVIYNGIEAHRFMPRGRQGVRKQLGYDGLDLMVLFVGRLHPCKDPLTLIKGLNEAFEKNKNLRLIMIGTGGLHSQVVQTIEKLNLSGHVRLLSHVGEEKMKMYYNASDFFILPSINEAFGIVLLEAMASGLPIIASNSGACSEIIGNAGILFNQGDSFDLARKIIQLSGNGELLRKLSKEGLKRVLTFSWENTANKYFRLYQRLRSEHCG